MSQPFEPPEPVTVDPAREVPDTLLTQSWRELTFVHWPVDPADVAPLLPAGTRPDTYDGAAHVGLVAFRMHRVGWFRAPGIPYLGTFPEINVRLYSVDQHGRRGVVFRSLEASRLLPVLLARSAFRLPYTWAKMRIERDADDTLRYTSSRRWPSPRGARCDLAVRIGAPLEHPTDLEHFLTARWGLHNTVFGRTAYLPNTHPRWPLHTAELLHCEDDLITAAGLPAPQGEPISVLYSPGVPVRIGRPRPHRSAA